MRNSALFAIAGLALSGALAAQPAPPDDSSRGRLLYATHCIACHNTQVHWRAKRLARNWTTLKAQVRDWQRQGGLGWSDGDIVDVARYLNVRYYHFESDGETLSLSTILQVHRALLNDQKSSVGVTQ